MNFGSFGSEDGISKRTLMEVFGCSKYLVLESLQDRTSSPQHASIGLQFYGYGTESSPDILFTVNFSVNSKDRRGTIEDGGPKEQYLKPVILSIFRLLPGTQQEMAKEVIDAVIDYNTGDYHILPNNSVNHFEGLVADLKEKGLIVYD